MHRQRAVLGPQVLCTLHRVIKPYYHFSLIVTVEDSLLSFLQFLQHVIIRFAN